MIFALKWEMNETDVYFLTFYIFFFVFHFYKEYISMN